MILNSYPVTLIEKVAPSTFILGIRSEFIAANARAGQFLNIKVSDTFQPLFRRPFSIYYIDGDIVSIVFQVFGAGTKALIQKSVGDTLNVIGPLGNGFTTEGDFETAILVGGGLGVAPLPELTKQLKKQKTVIAFLGGRSKDQILPRYLSDVHIATDDGSMGHRGTVLSLLEQFMHIDKPVKPKIFACGPSAMLTALGKFALTYEMPCEVSLETAMACGIGICQGCPVERIECEKKYSLVCKDGPVFDVQTVRFLQ